VKPITQPRCWPEFFFRGFAALGSGLITLNSTGRSERELLAATLLFAANTATLGQETGAMIIDIAWLAPKLEPDFTLSRTGEGASGEWTIVMDPTAARGRAIAQTSKDKTDNRFPLAVYQPYSGGNLEASVRFKAFSGSLDQAGGIAVRLLNSTILRRRR
jgi:hypothetical protein